MAVIDYILYFQAGLLSMFALPHILSEDGNMAGMGFEIAKFMPLKGRTPHPVPVEITLVFAHLCAIIGATQMGVSVMCLLAAMSSDTSVKKLAIRVLVCMQVCARPSSASLPACRRAR